MYRHICGPVGIVLQLRGNLVIKREVTNGKLHDEAHNLYFSLTIYGTWGSVVVKAPLLFGRSRDRFPVVSLGIFSVATDGTMCPGVDSASKNE